MNTYRCILTNAGLAKQAAAIASGEPLQITLMAVADAGGSTADIGPEMTELVGEKRRNQINRMFNPAPNQVTVEQFIPFDDAGGYWIRQIGIFDADGDLIAVASVPPSFRPAAGSGAAKAMTIRLTFEVSSGDAFTSLIMDPSVALVTVESFQAKLDELTPLILAGL